MVEADLDLMAVWFDEPEVAQWWGPAPDRTELTAKYVPRLAADTATRMWIVMFGDVDVGMAQSYLHADHPDTDALVGVECAVGIDYLLSAVVRGAGSGGEMLAALARHAFDHHPEALCCVATPVCDNERSWRALVRAGFERVGRSTPPDEPEEWIYVLERTAAIDGSV